MSTAKQTEGASLLEIVIAVGLISIILLALVSLSTRTTTNTTYSREKNQASRYSQEAIEWLRSQRDQSWSTFSGNVTNSAVWCLDTLNWNNSGDCGESETIASTNFRRSVEFERPEAGRINVRVVVSWVDGGNTNESVSETVLTQWQ